MAVTGSRGFATATGKAGLVKLPVFLVGVRAAATAFCYVGTISQGNVFHFAYATVADLLDDGETFSVEDGSVTLPVLDGSGTDALSTTGITLSIVNRGRTKARIG